MRSSWGAALDYLHRAGAAIDYRPDWLSPLEHERLWEALERTLVYPPDELQRVRRPFAGRSRQASGQVGEAVDPWVEIPRRQTAYGDPGSSYRFSGCELAARPWSGPLAEVRDALEADTGTRFNFVLVNLYRSGSDRMGWHADDERELGPTPEIASISLGEPRDFQLRHKEAFPRRGRVARRPDLETVTLPLAAGSLLRMMHPTQRDWLHQLPRRADRTRRLGPRLNLTFRVIEASGPPRSSV